MIKTDAPKAKIPKEKLVFGRTFTDHMLIIEWNKAVGGWGNPLIKPFGPLTLQPSASVLHYATEVNKYENLRILKCFFSALKG